MAEISSRMTKDEAYQQYKKALKQVHKAKEEARAILQEQLKALRDIAHYELRDIRIIDQKTKIKRR